MINFITHLLPTLEALGRFDYGLVFLAAFLESLAFVGTFIPGTLFVVLGGFLAAGGYMDVGDLIWFAAAGAILGDVASYYLGTRGAQFFRAENRLLSLNHLERGKRFFEKYGDKSIFFGRFIAFTRPIVPFVAGLSHMKLPTFLFWNVLSGILWSIAYILLGYFFGDALKAIEVWSIRLAYVALALIVLFAVARFFIQRNRTAVSRQL